jgi:hypothetical protein
MSIELQPGIAMGLEGVTIRYPPALGDGFLFSWIFEGVGGASFIYPWDVLHPEWQRQSVDSLAYELACAGNCDHPLTIQVQVRVASDDQVELAAHFVNPSARSYAYCWADMCLMFKGAPAFADEHGERCLLHTGQGLVSADRWPRRIRPNAWSPLVQAYSVEGVHVPYPYGVVQGLALWSVSPRPVCSGCVMMARADAAWHIGLGWDQSASVAHNPDDDHHCIHSDPWFGTVPAGSVTTRRGVILFVQGSATGLLQRFVEWKKNDSSPGR